ncbi:MAG: hypothetical protein P4L53_20445 [Candidatus Obscuribacterales bacterium]|nr:hypothetical protein [Candidatus Obscuribacterales bacterium]
MKRPYLVAIAIAIATVLALVTMLAFKWEPSSGMQLPLFMGYLLILRCFKFGAASKESFLSWRMRWTSTLTVAIAFSFAAIVGICDAATSERTFRHFASHAFGTMSFFCLVGGGGMAWIVLFVPLFLISGATSIRSAWEFAREQAAPSNNSPFILISRWFQELS